MHLSKLTGLVVISQSEPKIQCIRYSPWDASLVTAHLRPELPEFKGAHAFMAAGDGPQAKPGVFLRPNPSKWEAHLLGRTAYDASVDWRAWRGRL